MNKPKDFFNKIKSLLKKEDMPFDNKSLYLTLIYGVFICLFYLIVFSFLKSNYATIHTIIIMIFMFTGMLYILVRFDEMNFIKILFLVIVNVFLFPTLFYITGDINNGIILFFIFGIITTFFIICSINVYVIVALEILWYCFIILQPMLNSDKFVPYQNDGNNQLIKLIFCTIGACVGPVIILCHQNNIFEKMHKKLENANNMMQEAKLNKSRFMSNMTTEIRTPMSSIVTMNELILREQLDSESRELAENMYASSTQLLKIVNNILEFSKLDTNKMELYPQKYELKKMITEIINTVSVEYSSEENEFYVDIDHNIPNVLFGDYARIKQVFLYLLFSTVNKMPHNRIFLNIKGDVNHATNTVMLTCSIGESGIGLSDNEIDAMLSAFSRYDSRQKSNINEMGLEVSICKDILARMGGNLYIDSIEGVGISVKFEFINYIIDEVPIVKLSSVQDYSVLVYCNNNYDRDIWMNILAPFSVYPTIVYGPSAFRDAIEDRKFTHIFIYDALYSMVYDTINVTGISDNVYVVAETGNVYSDFGNCKILRKPLNCINVISALNNVWNAEIYKISNKRETVTYPEAKVLIVDDSVVNLKVLEGMLSTFGVIISSAQSGEEGLKIMENQEFDLIILDQRMPNMDGIEVFQRIKKMKNANSLVPVLCATADFGSEVARYLADVGFDDYLAKPVRRHYLERMLRKFLPVELAVNSVIEEDFDKRVKNKDVKRKNVKNDATDMQSESNSNKKDEIYEDTLLIHYDLGKENVGGSEEGYCAVLKSFYKEGLQKLKKVPELYNNDIALYVIEVHALKSSCAAIGAKGMSALFKDLEFAGRANNIEFIEANNANAFAEFEKVLPKIKEYLVDKNMFEDDSVKEPDGEVIILQAEIIEEIINALAKFNLRQCEEKICEISRINYGSDVNSRIASIKDSYERFDYHKVKEDLNSLLEFTREG